MSAPAPRQPQAASAPARPSAAIADPAALDGHPLAPLHEAFGNLAVLHRLADPAVQTRLEVGAPDDEHEREADAIAAAVMRRPEEAAGATPAEPTVRRRAEDDDKKKGTAPQRAAGAAAKAAEKPKPPPPKAAAPPKPADKPKPPAPKPAAAPVPKPPEGAAPGAAKDGKPPEAAKAPGAAEPERKRDEPVVAAKAAPGAVPAVTPAAAQTIQSQSGAGRPLAGPDRAFFEQRLGHDLGGVRVHDDAPARAAAQDIQAQAFTYGQDIYFAASRYQPGTAGGRELLAHELAHTVQQRPGARVERRVQRQPNTTPAPSATTTPAPAGGTPAPQTDGTRTADTITFPNIGVPQFRLDGTKKDKYTGPMKRSKDYSDAARAAVTPQRDLWTGDTAIHSAVLARVNTLLTDSHQEAQDGRHVLKSPTTNPARYFIGSPDEIATGLSIPSWDSAGHPHGLGFDVDHILELQLANFPTDASAHHIDNLELLDASVNRSSGSQIRTSIESRVNAYLAALPATERDDPQLGLKDWKTRWNVAFGTGIPRPSGRSDQYNATTDHWTKPDIVGGNQFLNGMVTVAAWSELGGPGSVRIFPSATGGIPKTLSSQTHKPDPDYLKPFTLVDYELHDKDDQAADPNAAVLSLQLGPGKGMQGPAQQPPPLPVPRLNGARFAGYISKQSARATLFNGLSVPGMSPLTIDDIDIGPAGFQARGRITADVPILQGAEIDLALNGDELTVSKTFSFGDFKGVPAPLKIDNTSLTVAVSNRDLSLTGRVDASIDKLGTGFLEGRGSIRDGFALSGGFTATTDLFRSNVTLDYTHGELSGRGTLDIDAGKIPGVSRGHLEVAYAHEHFSATGNADFTIPGVRSGEVRLDYDAEHGLVISGTVAIGQMPGIREGSLSVTIAQREGGAGYKLSGHGTATPSIPGVDAQLTLDYDDGAFLAHAQFGLRRGLLDATVDVGATNRPLDADGRPVPGGAPLPDISIFGSGTATLQITPWLRGTATVRLLPNGEFAVSGTLAVPGVNLWEPITPAPTNLFESPPITIPIFGPVVLELGGGLNLEYGVGAGVLSGSLGIEYNPSHEDQTHLHGNIHLHASAFAGIELHVHATVGLSAIIGSVTGGVELGAELRAEATADPDIAVDWRPDTGFVLDATVAAAVTPKLVFFINALITARAGPFHKDWRKNLARREFGSGLQLGVSLPIHYEQGRPFAIDWNQIHVDRPEIDPVDTARRFIQEVTR